jgi:hypothetical protein
LVSRMALHLSGGLLAFARYVQRSGFAYVV